jgi:hypothetical protein
MFVSRAPRRPPSSVIGVRPAVNRTGVWVRAAFMTAPTALAVPTVTWTMTTCGRPVTAW